MSPHKWFGSFHQNIRSIVLQLWQRVSGTGTDAEVMLPRAPVQEIATGSEFSGFGLAEGIVEGLTTAGFQRCTPIQERTLPITLEGRDVAVQAETGSGKTAAFLITILHRLTNLPIRGGPEPGALILAPTRELALQIYHDARLLGRYTKFRFVAVYGGVGYQEQIKQLRNGVDVVIATPGRLIDYIKQSVFRFQNISLLVIDEADRMLDMGFIADLRYILRRLPPYDKRQSMLFSATLSPRVLELTYEYMNAPEEIVINPETPVVATVEQVLYHVSKGEKLALLLGLLKREAWQRILVFANTKARVGWLAEKLTLNGYTVKALSGDMTQQQRMRIMQRFKQGKIPILVATDVASRGIHVEDITHVINYDVPQDREEYVHRIGRTARAGKTGKAITFACEDYVYFVEPIEEFLGQKIPVAWPEEDWFVTDVARHSTRKPAWDQARRGRKPADRAASGRRRRAKPAEAAEGKSSQLAMGATAKKGQKDPRSSRRSGKGGSGRI